MQSVPATTDLVIDGVVGISGSRSAATRRRRGFAAVDEAGIPVVAVDIPSGVDVQTGAVSGPAVHAALTVTFGGLKPVHALGDCGRVELVDIGLDLPQTDIMSFDAADVAARWPTPGPKDDKYTQGVTGILAGSATYPGCGRAVHRRGGGRHLGHGPLRGKRCTASAFALARGHRIAEPGRGGSGAGLGRRSGLGTDDVGASALWFALDTNLPVIVDADALTILAAHPDLRRQPQRADGADPACRRVRAVGRYSRPATTASPPPAGWPTNSAQPCC